MKQNRGRKTDQRSTHAIHSLVAATIAHLVAKATLALLGGRRRRGVRADGWRLGGGSRLGRGSRLSGLRRCLGGRRWGGVFVVITAGGRRGGGRRGGGRRRGSSRGGSSRAAAARAAEGNAVRVDLVVLDVDTGVHDLETLGVRALALVDLDLADAVALAVLVRVDLGVITPRLARTRVAPWEVDLGGHRLLWAGEERLAALLVVARGRVLVDEATERLVLRRGDRGRDLLDALVAGDAIRAWELGRVHARVRRVAVVEARWELRHWERHIGVRVRERRGGDNGRGQEEGRRADHGEWRGGGLVVLLL